MIALDVEQGSPVWLQARCGSVTSSRVADVLAKRKDGKEAAARRDLRYELVCEQLTGRISDNYVSKYMKDGIEREPLARAEYELRNGVYVEQVGFVCHPTIKLAGCSPDGLVGGDGLIEIKCPKPETHLEYLLSGEIPADYLPQIRWQLACTGCEWCDFVSYHPDLPDACQLFVKRLLRDKENDAIIRGMELEVTHFLAQVAEMVEQLGGVPERENCQQARVPVSESELITDDDMPQEWR